MKTFLECWIESAKALFSQALAGEPQLLEAEEEARELSGLAYRIEVSGSLSGRFTVILDQGITDVPLLGEGVDQGEAWAELLREVADAATGELLASTGQSCKVNDCRRAEPGTGITRSFQLTSVNTSWSVIIQDGLRSDADVLPAAPDVRKINEQSTKVEGRPGLDLLLDVELEAALRFGCCEMPLGEILELGPGDVVELDRLTADPVDLIVGDKIVARGEVVLVNGNFGLRITEVSAPQRRLESIRCLF
jgi:flagellar motor switch protein FliN